MKINLDTDVLIVIDPQNDFCHGGVLAVEGADDIMPVINKIAKLFKHVVITQDWHPVNQISFASNHEGGTSFGTVQVPYGEQTLWPDHCVQGTPGAEFHPALDIPHAELILRKGNNPKIDSYSAFFENDQKTSTGLGGWMRDRVLSPRAFIVGLAYDFCVAYSALDAKSVFGIDTFIIKDATRAIGMPTKDGASDTVKDAEASFVVQGVQVINSIDL